MLGLELFSLLLLAAAGGAAYYWYDARQRRLCLARLGAAVGHEGLDSEERKDGFPQRHFGICGIVTAAVVAVLYFIFGLPVPFLIAFGGMVAVICFLVESIRAARMTIEIEVQLADAIDVMVGALRAGSTLPGALDVAVREARWPLEPYLAEVAARINLGSNPETALQGLVDRVPLEEFRLFAMTLATQWWVGGSIASTLSRVGRTIRDRVELSRRIRSQRVEAEISVIGILAISYIVLLIIWRGNPEPTVKFLSSAIGMRLAAVAVLMQATGIVWITRLGQIRF